MGGRFAPEAVAAEVEEREGPKGPSERWRERCGEWVGGGPAPEAVAAEVEGVEEGDALKRLGEGLEPVLRQAAAAATRIEGDAD